MAVTDPILSAMYGYPVFGKVSPIIYGSFLINVWIGRRLMKSASFGRIATASVICSLQFFVLTNGAVWAAGSMYPHTASGLAACFLAAVPFYGRTMAGDLIYSGFLFGLDAWLARLVPSARREFQASAASRVA
jgi:hypothetical protein